MGVGGCGWVSGRVWVLGVPGRPPARFRRSPRPPARPTAPPRHPAASPPLPQTPPAPAARASKRWGCRAAPGHKTSKRRRSAPRTPPLPDGAPRAAGARCRVWNANGRRENRTAPETRFPGPPRRWSPGHAPSCRAARVVQSRSSSCGAKQQREATGPSNGAVCGAGRRLPGGEARRGAAGRLHTCTPCSREDSNPRPIHSRRIRP